MSPNACTDLPVDSGELATIVADRSQPESRRNAAMEQLRPHIVAIAKRLSGRFPLRLRNDLEGEAAGDIWRRIGSFRPEKGRFDTWCRIVLRNAFRDRERKERHRPDAGAGSNAGLDPCGNLSIRDDPLADSPPFKDCDQLRQALDDLRRRPAPAERVNYFAVLLLQLRLALAHSVSLAQRRQQIQDVDAVDLAGVALPWPPTDAALSLKPGWPPLEDIWKKLHARFVDAGNGLQAKDLCAVIHALRRTSAEFGPDVWNHWVKRAKEMARSNVDRETWNVCFRPLLHDRQRFF